MPTALLQLSQITKNYAAVTGAAPVTVLRDISLSLNPGDSVAIIGPSGSGKSTLLNIIGTLDHPTTGSVLLEGLDLSGLSELQLAEIRNRRIGFIFQSHHLLPQCSVLENVLVPTLAGHGSTSPAQARQRAQHLLSRVGLKDRLSHRPGQLSGGERQRVAVVRALINGPRLLLADEPTGALDRESAEQLGVLLEELNREEKTTLVVVTHSLQLARRLQRAYELRAGTLQPWNG